MNTQHASGAVYQVGDQFTETRYDRNTATDRKRPIHSPAKEHEFPGNEGKRPAPRRQRTNFSNFQLGGGQPYWGQTKTKPNQNHSAKKKATAKKKMPLFSVIGQGFTFAPKTGQQKLFQAWLTKQQEQKRDSTPGKASSVVQNMQNETSLPPSLGVVCGEVPPAIQMLTMAST